MKTFWITGARGFIGRHLARHLKQQGFHVLGLGHGAWSAHEAAHWGLDNWFNGDVTGANLARIQAESGLPEGIFHFAGGSSVGAAIANPYEDFQRTVASTAELLEWLRQHAPFIPLVAVSSAAVYGAGHAEAIKEVAIPVPYSPYGTHKLMMEEMCRSYSANYKLRVLLPRLFSVYGPELRKQLLWDLCGKMAHGDEIELGGSGVELRDWTCVEDIVAILVQLLPKASDAAPVFNVATGEGATVHDVATVVAETWAANTGQLVSNLRFTGNSRAGDPPALVADISRLHALDMRCLTPWQKGVADYVKWYLSTEWSK